MRLQQKSATCKKIFLDKDDYPISSLFLFDRVCRETIINIGSGNIAIIGNNDQESILLKIKIIEILQKSMKQFEIIDLEKFCHLKKSKKIDKSLQYLIYVNFKEVEAQLISKLLGYCKIKFIFKIPTLDILCSLRGILNNERKYQEIFKSFDNPRSIQFLVSSLDQAECLLIDGKKHIVLKGC